METPNFHGLGFDIFPHLGFSFFSFCNFAFQIAGKRLNQRGKNLQVCQHFQISGFAIVFSKNKTNYKIRRTHIQFF